MFFSYVSLEFFHPQLHFFFQFLVLHTPVFNKKFQALLTLSMLQHFLQLQLFPPQSSSSSPLWVNNTNTILPYFLYAQPVIYKSPRNHIMEAEFPVLRHMSLCECYLVQDECQPLHTSGVRKENCI